VSLVLRFAAILSLLLHLCAFFVADQLLVGHEDDLFRARLNQAPRFLPIHRVQTSHPTMPRTQIQYQTATRATPLRDRADFTAVDITPAEADAPELRLGTSPEGPKAEGPELALEEMPQATQGLLSDTVASQRLDLVRIEDMIRADKERAAIITDPDSVRKTRGFIKFTPLALDGAWSYAITGPATAPEAGRPVLEDLARYMRDHTQIHAQIRSTPLQRFHSLQLLLDPIHFFFPGPQRVSFSDPRVRLDPKERDLLLRYLKVGGFIFVDAGLTSDDRRFLMSMVEVLRQIVGTDGRLSRLPVEHPIYHAFYNYPNGFPSEHEHPLVEYPFDDPWYYPDRPPDSWPPRGMYGIDMDGRLVGVISDLSLHRNWIPPDAEPATEVVAEDEEDSETETSDPSPSPLLFLRPGTNIIVHALLRPEGFTIKHGLPAWQPRQDPAR
jgi:hypothetical protein